MINHARKLSVRSAAAWVATIVCVFAALPASARQSEGPPWCFDAAVVAAVVRQAPGPIPNDGRIYMRWPWTLDLDVQEVVFGNLDAGRLRVTMALHNDIRSDLNQLLFFVRREPDGTLLVTSMEPWIIPDRRGRYVLPFAEPANEQWLYPHRWIGSDYREFLQPIAYSPREASWLWLERWDADEIAELSPQWAKIEGDYVVARRGIPVRDLVDHALTLPGARCEPAA